MSSTKSYGKFRYYSPNEPKPETGATEVVPPKEYAPFDFFAELAEMDELYSVIPRVGGKQEREAFFAALLRITVHKLGLGATKLSEITGIHPSILSDYIYGYHVPAAKNYDLIKRGLRKVWLEMQHPVISNMEKYGTPDGKEIVEPRCPICKSYSMSYVLRNQDGEIVGCDECLRQIDPWDCPECGGGTV